MSCRINICQKLKTLFLATPSTKDPNILTFEFNFNSFLNVLNSIYKQLSIWSMVTQPIFTYHKYNKFLYFYIFPVLLLSIFLPFVILRKRIRNHFITQGIVGTSLTHIFIVEKLSLLLSLNSDQSWLKVMILFFISFFLYYLCTYKTTKQNSKNYSIYFKRLANVLFIIPIFTPKNIHFNALYSVIFLFVVMLFFVFLILFGGFDKLYSNTFYIFLKSIFLSHSTAILIKLIFDIPLMLHYSISFGLFCYLLYIDLVPCIKASLKNNYEGNI